MLLKSNFINATCFVLPENSTLKLVCFSHLRVPDRVKFKRRGDDGKVFPFHFTFSLFIKMSPAKKALVIIASSTQETQIETDIKVCTIGL